MPPPDGLVSLQALSDATFWAGAAAALGFVLVLFALQRCLGRAPGPLAPPPDAVPGPVADALRPHWPRYFLGTDVLGRSLLLRCLAGGGLSLGIGLAAALLSVCIGTIYGAVAGYAGGRVDGAMMRIVDILYGLPYVLLVVLLAVASDAALEEFITRAHAKSRWMHREAAIVSRERQLGSTLEDGMRLRVDEEAH